jgi:dienelactone hydrolase
MQDCSPVKNATEIIKYQNATHAFDMYFGKKSITNLGHTMTYDSDAHERSKQKVKEFLQKNL